MPNIEPQPKTQYWQLSMAALGDIVQGIWDIAQCIDIILATQKGSDPFRPNFGVDILSYLDQPANIAIPNLVREIQEQVALWETRAKITKLETINEGSALTITVYWEAAIGNSQNIVTYGR